MLDGDFADEVWFVVSPLNPFKAHDTNLLADNIRLELTRKALLGRKGMIASDYEFRLSRPSYMVNTLLHLREEYPDHKFSLLIGADNWKTFSRWYHYEEILTNHHVYIFPREGYSVESGNLPLGVTLLETPVIRISSTDVRTCIINHADIHSLVPSNIISELRQLYTK